MLTALASAFDPSPRPAYRPDFTHHRTYLQARARKTNDNNDSYELFTDMVKRPDGLPELIHTKKLPGTFTGQQACEWLFDNELKWTSEGRAEHRSMRSTGDHFTHHYSTGRGFHKMRYQMSATSPTTGAPAPR